MGDRVVLDQDSEDRLVERWRQPVIPIDVNDDPDNVHWDNVSQNWRHDFRATLKPSDVDRIREGYVCLHCLEPLEHAFPERCPLCQYECRARQAKDFERKFQGEEWIGSKVSMAEHQARLDEDTHPRSLFYPGTQILVPRMWGRL